MTPPAERVKVPSITIGEGHLMRGTEDTVRVGLLGLGTVGSEVYRLLQDHGDLILRRAGFRLAERRSPSRILTRPPCRPPSKQ